VATTLGTGLTADCTELNIDGRALAATRPTFGGSLLCTIMTLAYRPQMATGAAARDAACRGATTRRSGDIVEMPLGMVETDIVTKLLDFIPDANRNTVNLAYADMIVSRGKGLKNADNFKLVWDLARVLGAEVGATRAVVQAGWAGGRAPGRADRQDGAAQAVHRRRHLGRHPAPGGHGGSDVIVAINTDPNAPIFDFAHYGIVGNAMQVLPALTQAFRTHLDKRIRKRRLSSSPRRVRHGREQFDAIVVGAGPSGNTAAYTMAKAGLKVLQIERGEYPGSKNVQGAILYSRRAGEGHPRLPRRRAAGAAHHRAAHVGARRQQLRRHPLPQRRLQQAALQPLHHHPRAVRQVVQRPRCAKPARC
jgi:hypothetical protein